MPLSKEQRAWAREEWGLGWAGDAVDREELKRRKAKAKQMVPASASAPAAAPTPALAPEVELENCCFQVYFDGFTWCYAVPGDHRGPGSSEDFATFEHTVHHAIWYHYPRLYEKKSPMHVFVSMDAKDIGHVRAAPPNFAALPFVHLLTFVFNQDNATELSFEVTAAAEQQFVKQIAEAHLPDVRALVSDIPVEQRPRRGFRLEVTLPDADLSFRIDGPRAICEKDARKTISTYIKMVKTRADKNRTTWMGFAEEFTMWARDSSGVAEDEWSKKRIKDTTAWAERDQHCFESDLPACFPGTSITLTVTV